MTVSRRRFASALAALTAAGALAACNNDDVPVEDGASPGGGSGGSTKPGSGNPTAPATRNDLSVKGVSTGHALMVSLSCDSDSDASWSYTMSPEGSLKETRSEVSTDHDGKPLTQYYDLESVTDGEVTLTFTYGNASGPIQTSEISCTISKGWVTVNE